MEHPLVVVASRQRPGLADVNDSTLKPAATAACRATSVTGSPATSGRARPTVRVSGSTFIAACMVDGSPAMGA